MLKRNHHAKKLAARRKYPTSSQPNIAELDQSADAAETQDIPLVPRERSPLPKRPVPGTEVTRVSTLDPNLVIKYIHHNKPTLSIRSTGTSHRDDALTQRYPQLPKITAGERHVPCPYCRKPLHAAELKGSKGTRFWEHHIDNDLQPYVCLFAQCVAQFYTHRSDWAQHMRSSHGADWPRRVHCATWFCDIGHDDIAKFDNEVDWRAHMRDSEAHPGRKKGPTDLQLKALVVKKQRLALRDEHVCPLCEETPVMINILDREDSEDLAKILEDHIARHIKDLAFMSLPTPDDELEDETGGKPATSDGAEQQVSSRSSAPYPPTLLELMLEASLGFLSDFSEERQTAVIHDNLTIPDSSETFKAELRHRRQYSSHQFRSALESLARVAETEESYILHAWLNPPKPKGPQQPTIIHHPLFTPWNDPPLPPVIINIELPRLAQSDVHQGDRNRPPHLEAAESMWRDNGGRRAREKAKLEPVRQWHTLPEIDLNSGSSYYR